MKKFLLLVIPVLFLTLGATKCEKSSGIAGPTFTGAMSTKYELKSTKGIRIYSDVKLDPEFGVQGDAGLDRLFDIASRVYGYSGFSRQDNYYVWALERDPRCVNPGFTETVYSDPWPNGYDETYTDSPANHWDKDPRAGQTLLCAAGFMARGGGILNANIAGMGVVRDLGIFAVILRFEGEHNLLFEVDRDKYAATQYHYGTNGGHPILPDTDGSFVANPIDKFPSVKPITLKLPADITDSSGNVIFTEGTTAFVLLSK